MRNTPVSPGDALFPRMTASWYNDTLQRNVSNGRRKKSVPLLREGELYCVGAGTSSPRYEPVGLSTLINTDDSRERATFVSVDDVDQHNWVIPQEDVVENRPVLTVVFGLTRAWVTTDQESDNCVIYDPDSSTLVTAKEGKAQILVKGDSSFPSLINIGVQCNCIRAVGTVTTALTGTVGPYTLENLKGVNFTADELSSSISVYNVHSWVADSGALARAEWVYDNARWELYQISCAGS